jgi:hypothetical protein
MKAITFEKHFTELSKEELYKQELARHEEFIKNYKYFLDRITEYLDWQGKRLDKTSWSPAEIKDWVGSEITASASMDAPNKPGYYRAAND